LFRLYDRLTARLAALAAWLFVATGAMLVYEVVARYGFTAPTIWAEELSRLGLVWGTYLAAAWLLRERQHIRITLLVDRLPAGARRGAEIFSLGVVALLSAVAAWLGAGIAAESISRGSTTGTMLDLPMVVTEASIPVGFALLGLQALIEIVRLAAGEPLPAGPTGSGGAH